MTSIWNKNIKLFCERFPELSAQFSLTENAAEPSESEIPYKIEKSRNGLPTATFNGTYIHSKYSPERVNFEIDEEKNGILFLGTGLGYALVEAASRFPDKIFIVPEALPVFFFTALKFLDFEKVFALKNLVLALGASENDVLKLMENFGGAKNFSVVFQKQQTQHASLYFENIKKLVERSLKKDKVNQWTLEKFGKLWLKNGLKNIDELKNRPGISHLENIFSESSCGKKIPALVLGAGPTLDEILPVLKELKKRCILICVDTALRACIRFGVEPDFVLLLDPQYYAFRHISGLSSPSSVLVTESAVYPSAFRFDCEKILLCSSLFPLGKYFEMETGVKGKLEAGGSVSTSAWDFARFLGADEIFVSGLDLGFPENQTHIRGSTFEESTHRTSSRIKNAETMTSRVLFSANNFRCESYDGKELLTDDRMKLFGWWFETHADQKKTYSLSPKSLKIPGFEVCSPEKILKMPEIEKEKLEILKNAAENEVLPDKMKFEEAEKNLFEGLTALKNAAQNGMRLAKEGISGKIRAEYVSRKLSEVDEEIGSSRFKEIAALVFPSESRMEKIYEKEIKGANGEKLSLEKTMILYREIIKALDAIV